jgi:putative transposase
MTWIANGADFLGDISTNRLKKAYAKEEKLKARMRLHAALLRRKCMKIADIADTMEKPKGTISKWLNKLQDGGLAAAVPIKQPGRPRRLAPEQLKALRHDLLKLPENHGYSSGFWSTRLVKEHVKKKFNASFTPRHMTRLLSRIGFSFKKPRTFNPRRASAQEIGAFKKKRAEWCWLPSVKGEPSS